MWTWLRSLFRRQGTAPAEAYARPHIGRLSIARMRCPSCGQPLLDGDLVIWHEQADGWRSDLAHAVCVVILQRPSGALTRLSGEAVPTDPATGGILPAIPGALLLTEAAWHAWLAGVEPVVRGPGSAA